MVVGGECGKRDEHEQEVLIENDEEDIKERELPTLHAGAQNRPTVILGARVSALASEVKGEARSPE